MKHGWRLMLGPLWGVCIAGTVLIVCLAAGWYTWRAFALAGVIGVVTAIPLGIWNARKLRRDDPGWDTRNGSHR